MLTCLRLLAFLLLATAANAQDFARTILTGEPGSTEMRIGRDIGDLAATCGITVNIAPSAGSLENVLGVRQRQNVQFGIAQSDVLEYLSTFAAEDPAVARAMLGLNIALPLYREEVHILATTGIADLEGLTGKRVAIGPEASGTFLTASLVLDLAGVKPAEVLMLDGETSLAALTSGRIDAFFFVTGAPARLFETTAIDGARFHLLPVTDRVLRAVYPPAVIPAGTYPFQPGPVEVISVGTMLMSYDFDPNRNFYHRESCRTVSDIAHLVALRLPELRQNGHPKWRQVELNDLPPGWALSSCAAAGLDPDYPIQCTGQTPSQAALPSRAEPEATATYRRQICAVIGC